MNGDTAQKPRMHLSFQPTITLGTVIHIVFLCVLLVAAWTRVSDRLAVDEEKIADQAQVQLQQTNLTQQMQIQEMRTDTILAALESQVTRDEQQAEKK